MSYQDVYAAANDETFQGRCLVAVWTVAQTLVAEDKGVEKRDERFSWAQNALRDRLAITPKQIAIQVLRNPTIADNPAGASDGDILYQVTQTIGDLIRIG